MSELPSQMLELDEYVEQAHFFQTMLARITDNIPLQEMMSQAREEILPSTNLPLAIDYLLSELKHSGTMSPAMEKLGHYFTAFQTYLIHAAEAEKGRFDFRVALEILRFDAKYRAEQATPQGMFFFQFEVLCRNRLRYDRGLDAVATDPMYGREWTDWIGTVRRQIGLIDLADLVYVRSDYYVKQKQLKIPSYKIPDDKPVLFGEKEGKIALANRQRDPLFLFAALQRHLAYPNVPRPKPVDETPLLIPQLLRRVERLETRIKMMEEENRDGAIDLSKYYPPPSRP